MPPPNPAITSGGHQGDPESSRLTAPTTPVPTPRQRDPPTFSGSTGQDIEDWLSSFERVGTYNRWDDATKLANVAFYLEDLAKTWFQNHETEFTTWSGFRDRLSELFGKPTVRKANAVRKLSTRYQLPGESYAAYIEDVLTLCGRADPGMSEHDKITNITKGIAEEAFQYLLLKDPVTVTDVIHACTTLQEKRNTRLPQASVSDFSAMLRQPDADTLRCLIRELIREEIANGALRSPSDNAVRETLGPDTHVHAVHALVREEVAAALRPEAPPPARPTYADILRATPPVPPVPLSSSWLTSQHLPPAQTLAPLYPQPDNSYSPSIIRRRETRTCFHCGIQGHIARFCRRRRQEFAAAPPYFGSYPRDAPSQRAGQRRNDEYTGHYATDRHYIHGSSPSAPPRRRSVSPYRGRSPTRNSFRARTPSPQENP